MTHKVRTATEPFAFQDLTIWEMTPHTLDSASVAEIAVPAGGAHAKARSVKSDKLYVGLAGEVTFQVEEGEVRLLPGDTLAIPRGRWFAYANDSGQAARLLLVHVPPFDLEAEEFAPSADPA